LAAQIGRPLLRRHSPRRRREQRCWGRSPCWRRAHAGRGSAAHQHFHRRRSLRRRRADPDPRGLSIRPLAPYGQGKVRGRGLLRLYARLHGFSTVSLRYGNVYGPRQDVTRRGGRGGPILLRPSGGGAGADRSTATAARRAIGSTSPIVVRANLLAADSELTEPINIGTGTETSVLDLIGAPERGSPNSRCWSRGSSPSGPARCGVAVWNISPRSAELGGVPASRLQGGLRTILAGRVALDSPVVAGALELMCCGVSAQRNDDVTVVISCFNYGRPSCRMRSRLPRTSRAAQRGLSWSMMVRPRRRRMPYSIWLQPGSRGGVDPPGNAVCFCGAKCGPCK